MKRAAVLLAALLGCDPLLGGRCEGGWVPSPGACDAGAADAGPSTDIVVERDAGAPADVGVAMDAGDAAVDGGDALTDVVARDVGATDTACTPPEVLCDGACVGPASSPPPCRGWGRARPARAAG